MGALEEPPQTASIVEELLLALLGHAGDVFVNAQAEEGVAEPTRCTFSVCSDLEFVSYSDREVMDGLLELGFHYRNLQCFVHQQEFSWSNKQGSLYRCALANGICELLVVYEQAILKAHRHLRDAINPSLATLNYYLSEFKVLLPAVHQIAHEVAVCNSKGSEILQLLHHKACSGISEVRSCLGRLQWHCHQILFTQLRAWMVQGLLIDPFAEFFVQPASPSQPIASTGDSQTSRDAATNWHHSFEVRMHLLPPEVANETPLSILFIGKAVRVLQPQSGGMLADQLEAAPLLNRLQAAPAFDVGEFDLAVEGIRSQAAEKLWRLVVGQGELPKHLTALRDYFLMGRGDFWQNFLVESHHLLSLPVVRATAEANVTIPFQQSAAKSSAEGDPLFSCLRIRFPADQPATSAATQATAPAAARLSEAQTAVDLMGHSRLATPQFSHVTLPIGVQTTAGPAMPRVSADGLSPTVTPQTGEPQAGRAKRSLKVPDYDPNWDALTLEYKVQWPLHLLLSREVVMRYSRMFQFLFRLKRLQLELELSWAALKSQARRRAGAGPGGSPPLWQVRSRMAHFVNNLQLYIQVDVIEVQSHKLAATMAEVRDLKAASRAHEAFLAACVVQSCLDVPMFTTLLSKILLTCKAFCDGLQREEPKDDSLTYPTRAVEDFQRTSRLLYKLLSTPSMQSRARAPFLRQLLLRINFNGFVQRDTDEHAAAAQAPPAALPSTEDVGRQ